MGYADGYYYGQGRIICDTSTFSVGDTIRVRSMTDSSKVWNQQVATVGTALVFTVPCYDYYKICTVQTINDTPTEIGGVYKTVDYGQTLFINVLDKTTLGGIQGILNAHQELDLLNIGDEVTIKVNGADWIMQVGAINLYDSHEVIFVSKVVYMTSRFNTSGNNTSYISGTPILRPNMQSFYNAIAEQDKQYLKLTNKSGSRSANGTQDTFSDYVFPPNDREVFGQSDYNNNPYPQIQFPIFTTSAGRMKTQNGSGRYWWTCDGTSGNARGYRICQSNGNRDWSDGFNELGAVPCFRLTADS